MPGMFMCFRRKEEEEEGHLSVWCDTVIPISISVSISDLSGQTFWFGCTQAGQGQGRGL